MDVSLVCAQKVAIFLCAYNGEKYLKPQMDSFFSQTHENWVVYASDDGSVDGTLGILSSYAKQWGADKLTIRTGPNHGFVANFMSLVRDSSLNADYFAYADQDDIWNKDKLEKAVRWLSAIPEDIPALYCSRTLIVDEDNHVSGLSSLHGKPPSFQNALVQNIASGNTMVFNQAARTLLCMSLRDGCISYHDWWTYLAVAACGGKIKFDLEPSVRYRQHGNNQIGARTGVTRFYQRLGKLLDGRFRHWMDGHIILLEGLGRHLSESSRETLSCFIKARQSSLFHRLWLLRKSGVHRQSFLDNVGLVIAAILGRV